MTSNFRVAIYLLFPFSFLLIISNAATLRCTYQNWNADSLLIHNIKIDTQTHIVPKSILLPSAIALSFYPELKHTKIKFIIKEDFVPLTTMPSFWSVFKRPSNRIYHIIISNQTKAFLKPILLENLNFDSQIGVLAHELSHVADFQTYSFWDFVIHAIKYTLVSSYGDRFEFATDKRTIEHHAGYMLLAWSEDVRKKLDVKAFMREVKIDTTRERYMNPNTIKTYILKDTFYQSLKLTYPCF